MKILLLSLFTCFYSFAQLPAFTLEVAATPQSCLGNGMLTFTVSGTDTAATIEYDIYLLPETEVPFVTVTATTVQGLVAGEYIIEATQTINGQYYTATATAVISDEIMPFAYTTQLTNTQCGADGVITVTVTQGNAISYEIIAGPEIRALQASPVFSGLPPGQYQVRVHNDCGDAYVATVQLVQVVPQFYISENFFTEGALNSCGAITAGHIYANNNPMVWPVAFKYTVYPPGGGEPEIVIHDDIWSYEEGQSIYTDIPFYNGEEYTYDITITDGCGNSYTRYGNIVNKALSLDLEIATAGCGNYFLWVEPNNFVLPFTVNFVSAPSGFNPQSYNVSHPVSSTAAAVYGTQENPMPAGNYIIQIADACGNTTTKPVEIGTQMQPNVEVTVNNYCLGTINIQMPAGIVVSGMVTAAPEAYQQQLPAVVSSFITGGKLIVGNLPIGEYEFTITDGCGLIYEIIAEINSPPFDPALYTAIIPGCSENVGSIMLYAQNSLLDTVIITEAPSAFAYQLPYDASASVNTSGIATILSLPAGAYMFETIDKCGNLRTKQVNVQGFELYSNDTYIIRNCESFDIDLQYNSNITAYDSYWLQKFDEDSGAWSHPETGVPYTNPDITLMLSSILLDNNQVNYNFAFEGKFRIMKVVHYFGNIENVCTQIIDEFVYYDNPEIIAAYSMPCDNGLSEVIIEAIGTGPLHYSITAKNGEPFIVENGESKLFSGLEDALYNFRVTDACNNIINIQYNPLDLEPFTVNEQGFCQGSYSALSVPFYSFLTYEWWKASDDSVILSNANILEFDAFNPETDSGTYYLKIVSDVPGSCIDMVLEHHISVDNMPNSGQDAAATLCNNGEYNLFSFIEGEYDEGGLWEDMDNSGMLSGHICNLEAIAPGVYHFKYITNACNVTDEAIVAITVTEAPAAPAVMVKGTFCEGGNIQLVVEDIVNAEYYWTGPNNFYSAEQFPVIENVGVAASGQYTCTAIVNGCEAVPVHVNVEINAMPQFTLSGAEALCSGVDAELAVNADNFDADTASYTWYYEGILLNGVDAPVIIVSEPGTYQVVVTNGACQVAKQVEILAGNSAFNVALESGCRDSECVIYVVTEGDLPDSAFEWTGPDGFTATGKEIVITGSGVGIYAVKVTNAEGCTATAFKNLENTQCLVPKGISPGDATHNNSFDLSGLGVEHIQIFNRYGLQVYEKAGTYKNEWHGQSDKGELPAGTYYYVLSLSTGKKMTGWVYLKREN